MYIPEISTGHQRNGIDDITGFDETAEKQLGFFDSLNHIGGIL